MSEKNNSSGIDLIITERMGRSIIQSLVVSGSVYLNLIKCDHLSGFLVFAADQVAYTIINSICHSSVSPVVLSCGKVEVSLLGWMRYGA